MDVKYLKQVFIGFLSVVLVLSMLGYVIYHTTNGFSTDIDTAPALMADMLEYEAAEGYIFRNESVMSSQYTGTVNYNVSNGEKSPKGGCVATVYEGGQDQALTAGMVEIDARIALLESSNIKDNMAISDTKATDDEISQYINSIFMAKRQDNYTLASSSSDGLLISLNRRELIVTDRVSFDSEIARLRAERAALASALVGRSESIYMEQSGYFYYECDGYENIFLPELLSNMTPSALASLVQSEPQTNNAIGKMVDGESWYLALTLDSTNAAKYEIGQKYKIAFNDYYGLYITMTLERVSAEADTSLLVFFSGDMPDGFDFERHQSVSILANEQKTLRMPLSAIRINDGVEGVFVLYGNTVFFRTAEVVGIENGYAYVSLDTKEHIVNEGDENGNGRVVWSAVALYDEVIISGTGLYHTMIVN